MRGCSRTGRRTKAVPRTWHATQGAEQLPELRANLIERLLRDDYGGLKNELSSMNPTAFNALKAVCASKSRLLRVALRYARQRERRAPRRCHGDAPLCAGALAYHQGLYVPDGSPVAARCAQLARQHVLDNPEIDARHLWLRLQPPTCTRVRRAHPRQFL